ncbi:MAG: hypothetical protein ACI8W7_002025, partial [Gammaproteobacteria bacterium]
MDIGTNNLVCGHAVLLGDILRSGSTSATMPCRFDAKHTLTLT